MTKKPGVMIYFETGRAIKGLDYALKGQLFEAILDYAETGTIPELDGILSAVWPFVSASIDRDTARYEGIREQNRIKGQTSYFKRVYAPAHGLDPEDKAALAAYLAEQMPATVNNGQQQSTTVDLCQPIQPTTTPTPAPAPTPAPPPSPTPPLNLTEGVEWRPQDANIRESADAASDLVELDFEEKKRRAIERFMTGSKNTF